VFGRAGGERVELHGVDSPLDPIRVEITEARLLRPDADGGLHLDVALSDRPGGAEAAPGAPRNMQKWTIEYLELEVVGRVAD
jgi:hypothetical protein